MSLSLVPTLQVLALVAALAAAGAAQDTPLLDDAEALQTSPPVVRDAQDQETMLPPPRLPPQADEGAPAPPDDEARGPRGPLGRRPPPPFSRFDEHERRLRGRLLPPPRFDHEGDGVGGRREALRGESPRELRGQLRGELRSERDSEGGDGRPGPRALRRAGPLRGGFGRKPDFDPRERLRRGLSARGLGPATGPRGGQEGGQERSDCAGSTERPSTGASGRDRPSRARPEREARPSRPSRSARRGDR